MNNEIEHLGNIVEDDNSFCTKGHISCIPENFK
jgi:hypothetical protein